MNLDWIFENIGVKLFVFLTAVVAFLPVIVPPGWLDFLGLDKIDVVLLLLMVTLPPVLYYGMVNHRILSNIEKRQQQPPVNIEVRKDAKTLLDMIRNSTYVTIFLGLEEAPILREVFLALDSRRSPYRLYVNPITFLKMTEFHVLPDKNVQISDCPQGFCTVYAESEENVYAESEQKENWIMVRKNPKTTDYWTATIESGGYSLKAYKKIDHYYYSGGNKGMLRDIYRRSFFELFCKKQREEKGSAFKHLNYTFTSVSEEYNYATELLKMSTSSIHAVDHNTPQEWGKPYMNKYRQAHSESKAKLKIRIHIFDPNNVSRKEYNAFIEDQRKANVELYFLDQTKASTWNAFVIIDRQVVFTSREGKSLLEEGGSVHFGGSDINKYLGFFDNYKESAESVDEFCERFGLTNLMNS